jgi:hypothetical protein
MSPELGCWASVEHLRPSQQAWILASDAALDQINRLLERRARPGWSVARQEGIAPSGWTLIRDVTIDPIAAVESEQLERLTPRLSNRLLLSGGLPLPRGSQVYLSGGDPDVMLPPHPEDMIPLQVDLDGSAIPIEPGAALVSLAGLAPPEGSHVVRIGPISRSYSTVRTLGKALPQPRMPVGHELQVRGGELSPCALDAGCDPALHADGVRVLGSLVEIGSDVAIERPRSPLVLPRAARRRLVLSERPGVFEEVDVPLEPPWMRRAGLQCQSFEHVTRIDAQWLVTEWGSKGLRVRKIDLEPGPASDVPEADLQRWRQLVLACPLDSLDPDDLDAWTKLRERAEAAG